MKCRDFINWKQLIVISSISRPKEKPTFEFSPMFQTASCGSVLSGTFKHGMSATHCYAACHAMQAMHAVIQHFHSSGRHIGNIPNILCCNLITLGFRGFCCCCSFKRRPVLPRLWPENLDGTFQLQLVLRKRNRFRTFWLCHFNFANWNACRFYIGRWQRPDLQGPQGRVVFTSWICPLEFIKSGHW